MKTQREEQSVPKSQFDELAKTLADGLTRRRTLQLIGGSVTGALALFGMPKAWGDDGKGKEKEKEKDCSRICAPFSGDLTAFNRCKKACDEGMPIPVPPPPPPPPPPAGGPNRQICICGDGTLLNIRATVACLSMPAQDAFCAHACAAHGREAPTGCVAADPSCL